MAPKNDPSTTAHRPPARRRDAPGPRPPGRRAGADPPLPPPAAVDPVPVGALDRPTPSARLPPKAGRAHHHHRFWWAMLKLVVAMAMRLESLLLDFVDHPGPSRGEARARAGPETTADAGEPPWRALLRRVPWRLRPGRRERRGSRRPKRDPEETETRTHAPSPSRPLSPSLSLSPSTSLNPPSPRRPSRFSPTAHRSLTPQTPKQPRERRGREQGTNPG